MGCPFGYNDTTKHCSYLCQVRISELNFSMLFVSLLSRGCVRGYFKQWGGDGEEVAVVFCLEKNYYHSANITLLTTGCKKIGFEV